MVDPTDPLGAHAHPAPPPAHPERVRPSVVIGALAILVLIVGLGLLFADLLQRGRPARFARLLAERGTVEAELGQGRDAGVPPSPAVSPVPGLHFALGPEAPPVEEADDPQRVASRRSFADGDAGVGGPPFAETWVRGTLRSVEGSSSAHAGDACWVRVLPVGGQGYNCLVRVTCGETLLYPDGPQQAGYAPCELDAGHVVRGTDTSTSGRDGDPTLDLDLERREVRVGDRTPVDGDPYFQQLGGRGIPTFSAEIALEPPRA